MAVTDLAASGSPHRSRFADRIGRKVVEVHIALVFEIDDPVEALRVTRRAKRRRGEDLRLSPREDSGAVNARYVMHFAPNRPHFVGLTAVGANLSRRRPWSEARPPP